MDSKDQRGQHQEPSSVDLSQIKPKYTASSRSTLKNVLTEYGLPQGNQKKREKVSLNTEISLCHASPVKRWVLFCTSFFLNQIVKLIDNPQAALTFFNIYF